MDITVYVFQGALFVEQPGSDGEYEDLIRVEPEDVDALIEEIKKAQEALRKH